MAIWKIFLCTLPVITDKSMLVHTFIKLSTFESFVNILIDFFKRCCKFIEKLNRKGLSSIKSFLPIPILLTLHYGAHLLHLMNQY